VFLLKAGTVILVKRTDFIVEEYPWVPYTVLQDTILEKNQVWDAVALHNDREEIPFWAKRNIEMGSSVIHRGNKYSMVRPSDLEYID
jgi:hypothetical protein